MNSNPPVDLKLIDSFIFVLVMFSLQVVCQVPNAKMGDCEPKTCGNSLNITFPFWIEGQQPYYCGIPNFRLACKQSSPVLSISSEDFYIHNISYVNRTLLLSMDPKLGSSCAYPFQVPSLDRTPFRISPANKKLFFLNCTEEMAPPSNYSEIRCGGGGGDGRFLYIGDHQLPKNVSDHCGPPVEFSSALDSEFGRRVPEDFLRYGFLVNYSALGCERCIDSGGRCGFYNHSLLCICSDRVHPVECSKGESTVNVKRKILIGATGVTFALVAACLCCFCICWRRSFWRSKSSIAQTVETFLVTHGPLALTRYRYSEVKQMTDSFNVKLGQGGYGSVFRGKLHNGAQVAVKLLNESKGNGEDFINEVASIGRTNHINVVSLVGFCSEDKKRALIYEFMSNGSLEKFIYANDPNATTHLEWKQLFKITLGIARGLEYLHGGCKTRIVHFDIKPHNILLDDDFCPKISDFGLAKICPPKNSIISSICARGTIGYIAPEVFSRNFGVVSSKSDVYSYGMMVLEMVGVRKNANLRVEQNSEIYFPHWIYEHLEQVGNLQICGITAENEHIAKKLVLVGLWCIQTNPAIRPAINRVVEMLEGPVDNLQMPPKPYFCSPLVSETNSNISSSATLIS